MCLSKNITILYATVFHVEIMLRMLPKNSKNVLKSLKILSIGASTVSNSLRKRIKYSLTSNLYIRYATNDAGSITSASPKQIVSTPDTVGSIIDGVEVEIVDTNNKVLTFNQTGNIRVKSPGMIQNYINNEEANTKYFKNGWFYPGDLGKIHKG